MPTRVLREQEPPSEDPTTFIEMADRDVLEDIEDLAQSPQMFGLTFGSALSTAQLHCLHDPTANRSETWEAWTAAMQVGSALFAAATAT